MKDRKSWKSQETNGEGYAMLSLNKETKKHKERNKESQQGVMFEQPGVALSL